jgi:hypothetical protein
VTESRFLIAQLPASSGEADAAGAELRPVRPLLVAAYRKDSPQVRNLGKQLGRLR